MFCTFRYIAAEQVPVKYGGLSKDGEFANTDAVTETVKAAAKHTVEFPVTGVGGFSFVSLVKVDLTFSKIQSRKFWGFG